MDLYLYYGFYGSRSFQDLSQPQRVKKMKNAKMILWVAPLIVGLALIRTYEGDWFYDPFLDYFKGNYQKQVYPEIDGLRMFFNLFLRYFLNTILSLAIIQVLFKKREFLQLASFLYGVFFIVLIIAFFYIVYFTESSNLTLFYVRRFSDSTDFYFTVLTCILLTDQEQTIEITWRLKSFFYY